MANWKTILICAAALAAGTALLQYLDFIAFSRAHAGDAAIAMVAFLFLALGIFAGGRLFAPAPPRPAGNPAALETLGISGRELEVLQALAAGHSNKEIAIHLGLSPNTVKTHVARLFEKLQARRRTEALARARDFGLLD